jgi:hypothetical protein
MASCQANDASRSLFVSLESGAMTCTRFFWLLWLLRGLTFSGLVGRLGAVELSESGAPLPVKAQLVRVELRELRSVRGRDQAHARGRTLGEEGQLEVGLNGRAGLVEDGNRWLSEKQPREGEPLREGMPTKRRVTPPLREKLAMHCLALALVHVGGGRLRCDALAATLGLTEQTVGFYLNQLGCVVEMAGGGKVGVLRLPLQFPKASRGGPPKR